MFKGVFMMCPQHVQQVGLRYVLDRDMVTNLMYLCFIGDWQTSFPTYKHYAKIEQSQQT